MNAKTYDDIVVGSGISGMTLALLLGKTGRKVLLLEKNPFIGGSMSRFRKDGIPFDTGFHFTGGLSRGGILNDMLSALEIEKEIKPVYLEKEENNIFVFENPYRVYGIPMGIENTVVKLKEYFPEESDSIENYFKKIHDVCNRTVSMNIRNISLVPNSLDEDFQPLQDVLCEHFKSRDLRALLTGYGMCYGVRPSEISFANHSRVTYSIYESIARVENGGDAFITAFNKEFAKYDITVKTNSYIEKCNNIKNRRIGSVVLNTGEELELDNCVFTIHPFEILKTFPEECLSRAFVERVKAFEPSTGFFSVFAVIDNPDEDDMKPIVTSLFSTDDMDELMDPGYKNDPALVIMRNREMSAKKTLCVINAFELSFSEDVKKWSDSFTGNRPSEYLKYKNDRTRNIRERIIRHFPKYEKSLRIISSASMLTFRDYLNSPFGAAYGIKQKIGQFNLFGKMPLRNAYAAGQSSLLPGIAGSMMSSFIVGRSIIGEDIYNRFINERI